MKPRIRSVWCVLFAGWLLVAGAATAQNGIILEQDLDGNNQGYTVLRVWGSHYEMGFAQGSLLGDYIVDAVDETKSLVASLGGPFYYDSLRSLMAGAVWQPPEMEQELDGMVASLASSHPSAGIDKLDLEIINTFGDWGYACRSHICWGRYVAPPIKTLATRRLDFGAPVDTAHHHVLCARDPEDGSPRWVNLGWPGAVAVATGVNEFGTLTSLHDYDSSGADLSAGRMPRMVAARYALTFPSGVDVSTHLTQVFMELQLYEIMTGGFLNYYAPEGHGGVMTADPYQPSSDPDFHGLRLPQQVWHHGEAMITTNTQTDGTTTPADEDFGADAYYGDESPKTLESHWNLLAVGSSLHQLSVAYRSRDDMTLWADGRLDGGRTARLEWEWGALFDLPCSDGIDNDGDGQVDWNGGPLGEPADIGCKNPTWATEDPECDDGVDNADNDDPSLADWDGSGLGDPDPQCAAPWDKSESPSSRPCGLGAELAILLPPLMWLWRRRSLGG